MRRVGCLAQLARSSLESSATPVLQTDALAALQRALPSVWLSSTWGHGPTPGFGAPEGRRHNATHALEEAAASASASAATGPVEAVTAGCGLASEAIASLDTPSLVAHSSLEDSLALLLSPPQLGAQLWEASHAASGLPWWAAIPATTLALRAALGPLSLKAYAASANIVLLHRAVGVSRSVMEAVAAAAERPVTAPPQAAAGPAGTEEEKPEGAAGASGSVAATAAAERGRALGRADLVKRVAAHLRAAHGVPSFGWYLGNAALQVPLVVSMTLALRRMCDSLWPGMTGEGLLYFPDLTVPAVYLQTLSTPYGTAGAILPLGLVLLYVTAVDKSAGGSSPGINIALKLLALPLYAAALLQPHAVLLYWTTAAAGQLGLYAAAERLPALRRAGGVPEGLLPPKQGAEAEAEQVPLDDVLLALAESYGKSGNKAAAVSCLEALLARQPGHEAAGERLRALTAPPPPSSP